MELEVARVAQLVEHSHGKRKVRRFDSARGL